MNLQYPLVALLFSLTRCVNAQSSKLCPEPGQAEITYRGNGESLPQIYEALIACPEVQSLHLEMMTVGCEIRPEFPWSFDFRAGDRFPALEEMSLSGYDFGRPRGEHTQTRHIQTARFKFQHFFRQWMPSLAPGDIVLRKETNDNLEKWLGAMDWTCLRRLHLEEEHSLFYTRMSKELPGLRDLSLEWAASGPAVPQERVDFIHNIPPLDSLSILVYAPSSDLYDHWRIRTRFPIAEIIDSHAQSLRNLSLHQGEGHNRDSRRLMLSLEEISAIGASCTQLNHFGLDLDRDKVTGWPNATINAILQFPHLVSLDIGLEIGADLHDSHELGSYGWNPDGLSGSGPWREPRMSIETAEMLFSDFRKKKQGKALDRLEITVGDWAAEAYGGPLYIPYWEEGRARKFLCESERTGRKANGFCEVLG